MPALQNSAPFVPELVMSKLERADGSYRSAQSNFKSNTPFHKSTPVASWDLSYTHFRISPEESRSSGYFLPTLLWVYCEFRFTSFVTYLFFANCIYFGCSQTFVISKHSNSEFEFGHRSGEFMNLCLTCGFDQYRGQFYNVGTVMNLIINMHVKGTVPKWSCPA